MTTILAIEDNPAILENILETLQLGNFEVFGAENGLIGVNLAHQYLPDLIICDIMMPELDGYEVLQNLHNDPATVAIPFIFLTAKTERDALRQGMEFGADDYLTKPFTASELLGAVATRLGRLNDFGQEPKRKLADLRENLIHMLPHELRTPLTGILGYSELLETDCEIMDVAEIKEMAQHINRAGKRLHQLVENYLVYAQLEIAKCNPDRAEMLRCDYTTYPQAIIELEATTKAEQAGRLGDLRLDVENMTTVKISEDSLKKIVRELVDNAFKFSTPGMPVDVTAAVIGDRYVLKIIDGGCGMTQQQIADIGAYVQFERKLHEQQGSGLGLIIAKGFIELHRGELHIESVPYQQTIVSACLPLSEGTTSYRSENSAYR